MPATQSLSRSKRGIESRRLGRDGGASKARQSKIVKSGPRRKRLSILDDYEDIAREFNTTKQQAHNLAKRAFNEILDKLMCDNPGMSMKDVVVNLMTLWEVDAYTIKSMLNTTNLALITKELADEWKLREHGVCSEQKYARVMNVLSRKGVFSDEDESLFDE